MCAPSLCRRIDQNYASAKRVPDATWHGVALGDWAVRTLLAADDGELVLAVDERTLLAVVFTLLPVERFRDNFALALRSILEDLAIPPGIVAREAEAIALEPITPPVARSMNEPLGNLKYICEIELMYHTDLRTVQFNLNDYPHAGRLPCVSKDAIRELFRHGFTLAPQFRH
jgi:hypothetical protein